MPKSVEIRSRVRVLLDANETLGMRDARVCGCRDEWLYYLGTALQTRYADVRERHRLSERELENGCVAALRSGRAMAEISVVLDLSLRASDMEAVLADVTARYAAVNPKGTVEWQTTSDWLGKTTTAVTCSGNEWAIAAAWWIWLLMRLRMRSEAKTPEAILEASDEHDDAQWYEESDKDAHIDLWTDGQRGEPNPLLWLGERMGPLHVLTHLAVEELDNAEPLADERWSFVHTMETLS